MSILNLFGINIPMRNCPYCSARLSDWLSLKIQTGEVRQLEEYPLISTLNLKVHGDWHLLEAENERQRIDSVRAVDLENFLSKLSEINLMQLRNILK